MSARFACAAYAQEFRATITGRVLDASGGSVSGANVQAKNAETNEVATTTSDAQGNFTIPFLRPATYTLTAEAQGFKRFSREGITLQVGQTAGVNITLEVGTAQETVTVTGEVPLLDTEKSDRGGVVNTEQVTELPLNARNPYLLGLDDVGRELPRRVDLAAAVRQRRDRGVVDQRRLEQQ